MHSLRKTRGRELRKGPRKRRLARNGPEAGPTAQPPQCRVRLKPVDQVSRRRKAPHGPGRKGPRKSAAVFRRATPAASRCAHEALDADQIRRRHETAVRPRQRAHLLRQRREQLPLKPMPEIGWLRAQGHRGCLPGRLWAQTRDTTGRPRNPTLPQNQPKSRLFGRFCKRLDWVNGKGLEAIAGKYFSRQKDDEAATAALTDACRAIYRTIANSGTWGISALSRVSGIDFDTLSEAEKRRINALPAMIYHGANSEDTALMHMNSAPRSAAEALGSLYREVNGRDERRYSVGEARHFLQGLGADDWEGERRCQGLGTSGSGKFFRARQVENGRMFNRTSVLQNCPADRERLRF